MNNHLSRLAVASWGTAWGVLLATLATAALIVTHGDTDDRRHPALLQSSYLQPYEMLAWQEHYEHIWYVLVCVLGVLGAWATRFVRVSPLLAAFAAIAFVPATNEVCRGVFAGRLVSGRLFTAAAILASPLLSLLLCPGSCDGCRGAEPRPPTGIRWRTAVLLCLPLVLLLYGVFAPYDFALAAWECNLESHVGSYLVGPAQYHRAPGTVPALDFESHYGIGHALAFSWVMGNAGLQNMLERYVLFVLLISIAYFLSAHLVLTDWLRNPWAGFALTLLLGGAAAEGLAYTMPSCWPVRHPFAFAFLYCAVRGTNCGRWCVAAGGVAGLALFWQTDVGLFTLAGGAALYTANALFVGGRWATPALFLAAGIVTFFALCVGFFGPRVLSVTFVERLLEPLMLYATGFGTALMGWHGGWGWWYNLAGPGLAVASVGVLIGYGRRSTPPREVVYAAAASLLGLAMLTKWVNRSIDILWALNGGLILAVAGWWLCVAWRTLAAKLATPTRQAIVALLLLGLLALGVWADAHLAEPHLRVRSTSPLVRIGERLDAFPNAVNGLRRHIEPFDMPAPFSEEAVLFLRERTAPIERVAVISRHDWSFLAAAGRAPRLYWVQLFLVHSPVLLDRCAEDLRNCDRIFVDRDALISLLQVNHAAHDRIVSILADHFEPAEESGRWTLYRRRG